MLGKVTNQLLCVPFQSAIVPFTYTIRLRVIHTGANVVALKKMEEMLKWSAKVLLIVRGQGL